MPGFQNCSGPVIAVCFPTFLFLNGSALFLHLVSVEDRYLFLLVHRSPGSSSTFGPDGDHKVLFLENSKHMPQLSSGSEVYPPPPESELTLYIALSNRMWWKSCCVTSVLRTYEICSFHVCAVGVLNHSCEKVQPNLLEKEAGWRSTKVPQLTSSIKCPYMCLRASWIL